MINKIYFFLVILFLITGCTPNNKNSENRRIVEKISDVRVGFSQMENNGPWRVTETNSIISEAENLGVELFYRDAKGSIEQQLKDIEYLLEQNLDYLILAPKTYYDFRKALIMARNKNCKVILIDRATQGRPGVDYLTLIISDNIWEAEQAGKILAEATNGTANIIELTGTPGSSSAAERTLGFKQIINQYPKMNIIASISADFYRSAGKKAMENIIREHKENISAVFAHNDEMAIGAIIALKAAGIEPGVDVTVISIDGEKDALKAIIADDLLASIGCTPYFGPKVFDIINKHINNEKIEELYINNDRIFTKENAYKYIDEAF